MKQISLDGWRTLWLGKWVTTRYLATEEQIRIAHPEAQRIEGTGEVRTVAVLAHRLCNATPYHG
jgi:hypothetical protein